jgi:hypothetical protein
VFYLRLDEAAGPTLADATGHSHPGTVNGTVTLNVAGGFAGLGTAATPGTTTSDFIGIPANAALDITGAVTLECWYKPASLATPAYLMTKGKDDDTHASYGVYVNALGVVTFSRTEIATIAVSLSSLSVGTWYHLACTTDGVNANIYLNGAVNKTTASAVVAQATVKDYRIGGVVENGTTNGTFFPMLGTIDEVAIYNTALSAAQISAHYAARNTASGTNPGRRSAPPPFVATIAANLPPGLGGTPPGQAKKQKESPAARRRRTLDDYRRLRRRT